MHILDYTDYRKALLDTIRLQKTTSKGLKLAQISKRLKIQATYLSRSFHHPKTHLNDDHFDSLLHMLKLKENEQLYLWALRNYELSQNSDRRERLKAQLEELRRNFRLDVKHKTFETANEFETKYLMEPWHLIVHLALHLERYKTQPYDLVAALGISKRKISEILSNLESGNFITARYKNDRYQIIEVLQNKIHFGRQHPLMRSHQILLRSLAMAQLQRSDESHKNSFSATFTANSEIFSKVDELWGQFIHNLQKESEKYPETEVFQINFDLFRWL